MFLESARKIMITSRNKFITETINNAGLVAENRESILPISHNTKYTKNKNKLSLSIPHLP